MPDPPSGQIHSSQDLPYGPLPVRSSQEVPGASAPSSLEELVDLSWLEAGGGAAPEDMSEQALNGADVGRDRSPTRGPRGDDEQAPAEEAPSEDVAAKVGADEVGAEELPETSGDLSLAPHRPEADDDVHFGVAARALGVSRKTVERMVKRGQLERGPSNAPATVSKRGLVAVLEQRRRDISHLTRATAMEQTDSRGEWLSTQSSQDPGVALRQALLPVLGPLLDEFVSVRTRAAVLESQLESLQARAEQQRTRDELLFALATTGWWRRRKMREAVLRHYVLGDGPPQPGS